MAGWMGYAAAVALLLGGAAHLAEWLLRAAGRDGRWPWAAALGASLLLPAWMRWGPGGESLPPGVAGASAATERAVAGAGLPPFPSASALEAWDPWLAGGWLVATLLLSAWLAGGLLRLGLRARRWPRRRVAGREVLVSPGFGPALLGLRRPRVVLPGWSLGLHGDELEMILLHEGEHARAGDALLLPLAALAVVAAPWNPALWWQLGRLRGAVEVDCDRRVLARGVSPARYARLLLALGADRRRGSLAVAGFTRPASLLERRLRTMVHGTNAEGGIRRLGAAGLVLTLVILACEAPAPTVPASGETPPSEAAAAPPEPGATLEALDPQPAFFVDGVRVPGLPSLDPEEIERVEVVKGDAARGLYGLDGTAGVVRIWTKEGAAPRAGPGTGASPAPSDLPPEVRVDGRPFPGDVGEIDPGSIARIDVRGSADGGPDRIEIKRK